MKRRILIVDDNQSLLDSIIELLERQGYATEPVDDLGVARNLYLRNRPDLVLLDCDVRGCDGLELLTDLRLEPPPTPVIVMTARSDRTLYARCRQLGAESLLNKPFSMNDLVAEVQRILLARRLLAGGAEISPLRLLAHHFPKLLGPHRQPPGRRQDDETMDE